MLPEAIEIFKLNVEEFPEYTRAYNDLADAYMLDGNKKLAIENYNKTLELDSENWYAKEKLKQISKE